MNKLFNLSHQSVVKFYRILAVITLYGVLGCVIAYGFTMAFYAVNKSWAAPFILTPTNDKILDLTARMVTSEQALNALVVDRDKLQSSLGDFRKSKGELDALDQQFQNAIMLQKNSDRVDAPELGQLNARKRADNAATEKTVKAATYVEASTKQDLAAGLITKGDAALIETQIRQIQNSATDGLIGEVLMRDNVRQKTPAYSNTVDNLAKEAELKNNIVQLAIQIKSGEEQLATDKSQIENLTRAINTAKNSPYFLATLNNVRFAFVPYDNSNGIKIGSDVYDCYLNMVVCRKVGKVKQLFKDEEKSIHPIFKTDIRGFLVQLDLTDLEAAKDKVLFIGQKPLLL